MNASMNISLIEFMESLLKPPTSTFHRYMFNKISWGLGCFYLI